jgi:hypothetical protein
MKLEGYDIFVTFILEPCRWCKLDRRRNNSLCPLVLELVGSKALFGNLHDTCSPQAL